jgi:2,3-dihydroxybiphenyl 1,2-dioxygenase
MILENDLRPQAVTQLGYLGIGVSDLQAWRDFAGNVLGLQESGSGANDSVFFRIDGYHHRFEIIPTGEDDLLYAGWEVKDADAMHQVAAQLRALGTEVVEGSAEQAAARRVIGLIRCKDPDGLDVEVYYGPFREDRAFNSPRGITGFRAESLGLGHIVMLVDDVPACLRFYKDGLGVKISDYIYFNRPGGRRDVVFTHANPRHHSLAMSQRPQAVGGAPRAKRLSHFMVEVNELDDVGVTIDLAEQRGMSMGKLGRHTNDLMISFYVTSPSGFNVEYGWGGLLIEDEAAWNIRHYEAASMWGHGRHSR